MTAAMYHFSAQALSRKAGRSSVAASAYRAGVKMVDERTGVVSDYRKKKVLHSQLLLPGGGTADRSEFWNKVEAHHKRGDAVVAREFEISLPRQLNDEQRQELALAYAQELADKYGVAVDVALHEPNTVTDHDLEVDPNRFYEICPDTGRRHNANWHAHLLMSACHVDADGNLGKKCVELDPIHMQRVNSKRKKANQEPLPNAVEDERSRWADVCNAALAKAGHDARVDHRTLKEQGIDREPTTHHGPTARSIEAETGKKSDRRISDEEAIAERAAQAAAEKIEEAQLQAEIDAAMVDQVRAAYVLDEYRAKISTPPPAPAPKTQEEVHAEIKQLKSQLKPIVATIDSSPRVKEMAEKLAVVSGKKQKVEDRLVAVRESLTKTQAASKNAHRSLSDYRKKHPFLSWFHKKVTPLPTLKRLEQSAFGARSKLSSLAEQEKKLSGLFDRALKQYVQVRDDYTDVRSTLSKQLNAEQQPVIDRISQLSEQLASMEQAAKKQEEAAQDVQAARSQRPIRVVRQQHVQPDPSTHRMRHRM